MLAQKIEKMKGAIFIAVVTLMTSGCSRWIDDFAPATSISNRGFATRSAVAKYANGSAVKIWGYVDYGNIAYDPASTHWSFKLKANAKDAVGESFRIRAPKDSGHQELIKRFRSSEAAGKSTTVLVEGKLYTFDAPTNFKMLTGLYVETSKSDAIRIYTSD